MSKTILKHKLSYTNKINKHILCRFKFYLVFRVGNKFYSPICYRAK